MKMTRYLSICALAALLGLPVGGNAEDIDIYSGLSGTGNTPNVLFVMDNAANFSSSAAGTTCKEQADGSLVINAVAGTDTAMSGTVGGIEQCALYNVIKNLPVNEDGSARVNIGMMVYNANNIRDVNNLNCGADSSSGGCLAQPLIPMDAANKTGFLSWIKSWKTTGGAGNGYVKADGEATAATMQEAWAYFYGSTGLSGRSYAGIKPASGCQKNFVIFVGNSYSSSGTPGDGGSVSPASALDNAPGVTAAQKVRLTNSITSSCGAYTFPAAASTHENGGYYADEWTRYMNQADLYSGAGDPASTQSIITYTVGILGASCQAQYAALLDNMAEYGGGKYFATSDYTSMVSAILQILNEIQAVNSVFASSSLPVSVNAQGTYLNQIYMGMFRPDAGAKPRWVGNLKQYSFGIDANNNLYLGDSVGRGAISSAGTGFLSANAISYWTCSRSDNPYVTDTTKTSAAELSSLTSQGQICASDPAGGFWVNTPGMANSASQTFDLADGELVEKGGAAQQMRLANLTNDYATAAGSATNPRKLYTFCPGGTSCKSDLTHSDNAFATTNPAFTAGMFGGSSSVNVSSLTRSGDTVTVTTASNHGFANGDNIAIANASQSDYNVTKPITRISDTQFSYSITTVSPPTPASTITGNYHTFAASPRTVTQLARALGSSTITATSAGHGFSAGDTVVVSGSGESQYNGTFAIAGVTANTFTYTVTGIQETPPTAASGGTASKGAITANIATVARPAGTTTVTVTTSPAHGFPLGAVTGVTLAGILDASGNATAYSKKRNITVTSTTQFTFTYPFLASDTAIGPTTVSNTGIMASPTVALPLTITSLTRNGDTATATTSAAHGFADGALAVINYNGTPPANESAYLGTFNVSTSGPTSNTFSYTVPTTPATPATGASGATITATGGVPDNDAIINWIRGADNNGDETGPGGAVTVRPSLHGDVLHSRPTVLNYGGQKIRITATADSLGTRTATASDADVAKIGSVGATADIRFANSQTCAVTVATATTFQYSSSNCGAAGSQDVATTSSSTIVFYGDNGGVFHAVNGNQANPLGSALPAPGSELWGLIPSEMFGKFNRLRTNSPQLALSTTPPGISPAPRTKEYFVDGPVGVYQDVLENGTTAGAYIYLAMRRGGRMIYALDVTNPLTPKLKWKVDNNTLWKVDSAGVVTTVASGLSELGQTWSEPKVAYVAFSGSGKWVLIFGAGYAPEEDEDPPVAADTMGRGIFVLDAFTGELLWKATYGASSACAGTATQASCTVAGMDYSIPADITLMDRDFDGYIDRLYAADTGGNIWRVDLETANGLTTPNYWRVYKLAALGCADGPCSIPPGTRAQRKFFYPPEVITTSSYDAVIAGTGDREHPLYVDPDDTRTNRVVLLRDIYTGKSASGMTAITNNMLADIENCANDYGFKYSLRRGEKVVNAPLVTAGVVYFGTNEPVSPTSNSCTSSLGTARGYKLEPFSTSCQAPTSVEFAGGGMPPSPVSGVVNIQNADGTVTQVPFLIGGGEQGCVGAACGGSALEGQKPTIVVPTTRTRTYWYRDGK
ncbi:MAG: hypothetical protein HY846_06460 [Nitrosomonadales bacterium]|nr:hypothetical protein [Nitrosomonadales bacterium]